MGARQAERQTSEFGILVISHGELAEQLIAAMEHLMGRQEKVAPLCIAADEPLAETRRRLAQVAQDTASDNGLVVLTDLFGGTPANLGHELIREGRAQAVISGANLPMLVRLIELRGRLPAAAAVEEAAAAGRRFIRIALPPARNAG